MNKILLNGLMYEKKGAGISTYTKHLVEQFISSKEYELNILLRQEHKHTYLKQDKISYTVEDIKNSKERILYEQFKGLKTYNKYDLVHFPDYASSLLTEAKSIITLHDMAMYTMKEAYTKAQIMVKSNLLKASLKKAEGIICVSNYAKKELLKYFPSLKEDRIQVVHSGISLPSVIDVNQEKREKPYILYVGTIAPSKNVAKLMRAFERIKRQYQEMQLVIVGKKGWMIEEVESVYNHSSYKEDIVFTGFVEAQTLESLYQNAEVFVSPSLYEGFGFTPLEAMIRSVPTVVSDIPIFSETCEDSVAYFDPTEEEDIANRVLNVLSDEALQEKLKVKGYARASQFSWEETVKKTYAFYQEILSKQ